MSYLDKTFCASPNCKNECGRQLTPELKARNVSNAWVSYAYFCGLPDNIQSQSSDYMNDQFGCSKNDE